MYRLGCCIPSGSFMPQCAGEVLTSAEIIEQNCRFTLGCGFDYVESSVGAIVALTDEEIARLASLDLKIEAANSFIPGKYKIIEGSDELFEYAENAIRKCASIGIKVIVFGSGAARTMPDTATEKEKLAAVEKFLRACNEYAQKYDVTIVIEPLQKGECNFINRVTEASQIAQDLGLSNIRSLADSYHMGEENEPFSALSAAEHTLAHIHVAEKKVRTYPGKENDDTFLPEMAKALKATSYSGRISVECNFSDFASEAKKAYEYLNKTFNT